MRCFAFALLAGTSLAVAQTAAPGNAVSLTGGAVLLGAPSPQNCPVDLAARHTPDGGMVTVTPANRPRGQGYQLTLRPGNHAGIARATVTLHGMSGAHAVPATTESAEDPAASATDTFHIAPVTTNNTLYHAVIYTEKLTGVQWLELNDVTFADGAHWRASATATCRVAPNGFLLVAGTR